MVTPLHPGTTDLAGQVAIAQGVDSNVFQTTGADGSRLRHPAAFTSLESSAVFAIRGREDSSDVRLFARALQYEPLGPDFESRAARGGLSYRGSTRLDRRTTFITTLLGSVGSLQAARGTDAAASVIDPVSTRRSTWNVSGSETFSIETSRRTTVRILSGLDLVGTILETAPAGAARGRGLDLLVLRGRISALTRVDTRTFVESALLAERLHSGYTLARGDPASPSLGSIDGAAATATVSVARLVSRSTTALGTLGLTFAIPQFRQRSAIFPVASLGLVRIEDAWTFSALASIFYGLSQPRVGPGPTATVAAVFLGKPLSGPSRNLLDLIAEVGGQRTLAWVGANDGSSVTTGGGSLTARLALGRSVGLLVGYDGRATRFSPAGDAASVTYVRHLGFIGLSYAWSGLSGLSPLPTLVRPMPSPFSPL